MLRYSYQEDRPVLTICSVLKLSLQERLQVFNHMVTNEEFYAMENVASAKLLKATWFGVAADLCSVDSVRVCALVRDVVPGIVGFVSGTRPVAG